MSHRVNIIVDDQVWKSLQKIPKGERSQFISRAIIEQLLLLQRKSASIKMDKIREQLKPLDSNIDVGEILRHDRMRDK